VFRSLLRKNEWIFTIIRIVEESASTVAAAAVASPLVTLRSSASGLAFENETTLVCILSRGCMVCNECDLALLTGGV
jgi:hypothetical protein